MNVFFLAIGIPALICAAFVVSACQSSGIDGRMVAELPVDGKIIFGN